MPDNAQTLQEFTTNLLSDIQSGAISVHEALAAAGQYAYLREAIAAASTTLSEAAAGGDEELTEAVIEIISETADKIAELPNFQTQQPDSQETEKEIRDAALLQKTATNRIREAANNKPGKDVRRAFVHELVSKFSGTIPSLTEREMERLVNASAAVASQEAKPTQALRFSAELTEKISGFSAEASENQREQIAATVDAFTKLKGGVVTDQIRVAGQEVAVFSVLFTAEDMKRPDVFVDIVINAPSSERLDLTLARAEKLARAAHALETISETRGGKLQFFSSDGAKGVAGGLQKGADGLLSLVGEPVRDMVLREKVNGTLRSMLSNTQQFADRLGESFVHSALFTHIGQDLTKQLAQKPQGGGARGVFDDVFSSVFRGPLAVPLAGGTKNAILDYYELARANAAAPPGKEFFFPGILPWDIFRSYTPTQKSNAPFGQVTGVRRPFLSIVGFGSLGSMMSNLLSGLVDRMTSFTFLNPRLPGQLAAGRRAAAIPTAIVDDMPLFVALVVVVVLILFFLFPSPLNLNQLSHSSKVSALLDALRNKDGSGGGSFPIGTIGEATQTCANIAGVHAYQNNPSWENINCQNSRPDIPACRPPTECTIGLSGCGSTSTAMILNSFGSNTSVPTVWDVQHKNNGYDYYPRSCASFWSGPINILRDAGLSVFEVGISEGPEVLKNCGLLLAFVDEKWQSGRPTGHVIVITGLSQEGGSIKATTLDPMRPPGYVSTVTANPTNPGDIRIKGLYAVVQ